MFNATWKTFNTKLVGKICERPQQRVNMLVEKLQHRFTLVN